MQPESKRQKRGPARFCGSCGGPLGEILIEGRLRSRCGACGQVHYLNPASASAGVVLDSSGSVLLVRRAIEPYRGQWALPAGYQEADEEPPATVVREVLEETGIAIKVLGLLEVLFVPDDPRKPANVNVFLCEAHGGQPRGQDDALEAAFFRLDALPEPIGFNNKERILSRLGVPERYPVSPWDELRRRLRTSN